jgi:L-fuconolactonase
MMPDSPPFRQLPGVLELAQFPNVAMKLSAAPTLSLEPYPFEDLWEPVLRIVEAFGPERLMWGTDIQRVARRINMRPPGYEQLTAEQKREHAARQQQYTEFGAAGYVGKHTYAEAVGFVRDTTRLSAHEKAEILGGTLRRLLRWPKRESAR